ncbi:MAG: hypothetical protein WC449_04880 [Candidatus Paceibacterota bacterium]
MIEWRTREEATDGYDDNNFVASIYDNEAGFHPAILTKDGYMFLFNVLPDLELSKRVCELALNKNLPWEWWLKNQEKWWYENVSQI